MKRIIRQLLILFIATAFGSVTGAAQNDNSREEIKDAAVFEVRLPITVLDKKAVRRRFEKIRFCRF